MIGVKINLVTGFLLILIYIISGGNPLYGLLMISAVNFLFVAILLVIAELDRIRIAVENNYGPQIK